MLKYLIIFLLYFSAAVGLNDSLNLYALYFAIPLACGLSFFVGGNSLKKNKYIKLLLLMYGWIVMTYVFASHPEASARDLRACLGAILLCVTLANMAIKPNNIKWLYGVYIVLFLAAMQYARENIIGIGYDIATDRVNDENLNANTIAYYTFFVTYSLYMLGEVVKQKRLIKLFKLLFLATIPLSFLVAIFTASRQVLLIQVPLISLLLYFRYFKSVSYTKKIVFLIIGAVALIVASGYAISTYESSYLSQRSEKNYEEDVRVKIIKTAFKIGLEHPIFGVGPANFIFYNPTGHFSHCTYVELFANSGLPAALLFIYLLWVFIKTNWKNFKRYKDKEYLLFVVFGFIFAFDNIFFVFYNALWLMGFFSLVSGESITYNLPKRTIL